MKQNVPLQQVLTEISRCRACESSLAFPPKPVLRISPQSRILIIGQAPGVRAHRSGLPFDDASGDRLRDWLGVDRESFYDSGMFSVMPMGFCFPGKNRGGDMPPRPECAELWHQRLLDLMPSPGLVLLAGAYAQKRYLPPPFASVTATVSQWAAAPEPYFPIIHPSPRNQGWLRNNPWFTAELIPDLRRRVAALCT